MRVRAAGEADVDELVRLQRPLDLGMWELDDRLWRCEPGYDHEGRTRREFVACLDDEDEMIAVAEEEGGVIGFAAGRVDERAQGAPRVVGSVRSIYVVPGRRREGVASALVRSLVEFFASKGVEDVSLCWVLRNEEGRGFWRRLGFEPVLIKANARPEELRSRLRE